MGKTWLLKSFEELSYNVEKLNNGKAFAGRAKLRNKIQKSVDFIR